MNRNACARALIAIALVLTLIPAVDAGGPLRSFEALRSLPETLPAGDSYDVLFKFNGIALEVILPPRPAEFVVSDLKIKPVEKDVGEEVTISYVLSNIGEMAGVYNETLIIRGEFMTLGGGGGNGVEKGIEMAAGESKIVSHTIGGIDIPGNYTVIVENLRGSLTVKPRGTRFVVSDLSITPTMTEEGPEVKIEVKVTNRGEEPGTYMVHLYVDDVKTMTGTVSLEDGASKTVTFTLTDVVGDHEVRVDGLTGRFKIFVNKPVPTWLRPINIAVIMIVVASLGVSVYLLRRRLG